MVQSLKNTVPSLLIKERGIKGERLKKLHIPVLVDEVLSSLIVDKSGRYIDCTVGPGGHSLAILRSCEGLCQVLGIDADSKMLKIAQENLSPFYGSYLLAQGNFKELQNISLRHGFDNVSGILFDLGLSSLHLDEDDRGFSFHSDAPLDMRLSPDQEITASLLINSAGEEELADLFKNYGEERYYRKIARAIVSRRNITSARHLAEVIERLMGRSGRIHPATRVFQALRIAVNNELENLKLALEQVPQLLSKGGRLVVISYHSLEDRLVKEFMRRESKDCLCPSGILVCTCGHKASLKIITRKVIRPSQDEIVRNPRSRSAKMRVAERVQVEEAVPRYGIKG